jgi:hypothetical protein
MAPVSTIGPTVRKAVTDGLTTHLAGLADFNGSTATERDVEVSYGYPFGSAATEKVYTGRSRAVTPPAALRSGRNHRNENGVFDLTVAVQYIGGDPYDADLRAAAIGGACEDWLAARKSNELGVDGLISLVVESWEADYAGLDGGTGSLLTYKVRWTARLT